MRERGFVNICRYGKAFYIIRAGGAGHGNRHPVTQSHNRRFLGLLVWLPLRIYELIRK